MRFLRRKSGTERLLETVIDSLAAAAGNLTRAKALKAGLIAGGVAGLTAGSAGISSLRRRLERTRDG
jgi:tetrahydromethanopterin S-methyltransferase subunit F